MVAAVGVEPTRPFGHQPLMLARLPNSATLRLLCGAGGGTRTHPPLRTPVSETGASTTSPHRHVGERGRTRTCDDGLRQTGLRAPALRYSGHTSVNCCASPEDFEMEPIDGVEPSLAHYERAALPLGIGGLLLEPRSGLEPETSPYQGAGCKPAASAVDVGGGLI